MADRVLTVSEAVGLGMIMQAAQRGAVVARVMDVPDGFVWGTARSVGDERGVFARPGEDVRDCFLRVTLSSGFEAFWPVTVLVEEYSQSLFVVDYVP